MRKYNVFGQKLSKTKALSLMIFIFIGVLAGYYIITLTQTNRLESLEQKEIELNAEITELLESEQTSFYLEIGEIMPFLPTSYERQSIENNIMIAKGFASLHDAINYRVVLNDDVGYPLDNAIPDTLKTVRISISFSTDDEQKAMTYMDHLIESNYIYYIESVQLSFLTDGDVSVQMIVYTFYNQIS